MGAVRSSRLGGTFNSCFPDGSEVKASACIAADLGSIPALRRSPGEGNNNPLHYSCLENPMDRGAWWAKVHGVTKSRTRLRDFTFTFRNILVYFHLWSKTVHLPFTVQSPIKTLKEDKTKSRAVTHTSETVYSEEFLTKGHCGTNRKCVDASQPKCNKYTLQWQKQKPLECFASLALGKKSGN